ncbi:MAG TPA: ATPase domain-containing protein [Bacteroidota bacterium]|nr:ATPase domain-containing protein [Bacteroidota bacterium]
MNETRERDGGGAAPLPLPEVTASSVPRMMSHVRAIDGLLGGGIIRGSSLLLAGAPGAGKSTLLIQLLDLFAEKSLYVSGEESVQQLKLRADRLRISSGAISVVFETDVNSVISHVRKAPPRLLVIDSIQTVYSDRSGSMPGTPAQVRLCTHQLRRLAQEKEMVLLIVGQVTKAMQAAGPKLLEHAVDCVLSLLVDAEDPAARTLAVVKNRFGPAGCALSLHIAGGGFMLRKG